MNKKSKLPKKASELIKVALRDLQSVEKRSEEYSINMDQWHNPLSIRGSDDKCKICLAGAVMANTLATPADQYSTPADFSQTVRRKLYALNAFRLGAVLNGIRLFGPGIRVAQRAGITDAFVPDYSLDRDGFFKSLWKIQRSLAAAGL